MGLFGLERDLGKAARQLWRRQREADRKRARPEKIDRAAKARSKRYRLRRKSAQTSEELEQFRVKERERSKRWRQGA